MPLQPLIAEVRNTVKAAKERDPAAAGVSGLEILINWPGVQAVLVFRLAHYLYERHVPVLPRLLSNMVRSLTGVEIHPGATIGPGLFIDHGMGVVIGETTEIGTNVTLYQGCTLGGTGFETGKRHPTLADNVVVGSGAKLLGPLYVASGAKIGANTVVLHDVPENATVVGNPGHPVRIAGRKVTGPDTDWVHLPDPIADAMKGLSRRIDELERIAGVEVDPAQRKEPLSDELERQIGPNPTGG